MKKSEILELIGDLEDTADIDNLILGNGFAKPITDVEGFNKLLASNKEIQGLVDSKVTNGIETFKKNGMQKLIDAAVLKATNKEETPEQKAIREMKQELDTMKKEKARAERIAKFKDTLSKKKIPGDLMEFILGDDDETTTANIELFENSMKSYVDSQVQTKLNTGYVPGVNGNTNNQTDPIISQLNSVMGLQ